LAATVAGRLGFGKGCETTFLLGAERDETEPVTSYACVRGACRVLEA
jgi:hypothetical protein